MAHVQQLCFIETLAHHLSPDYAGLNILDIGSYNVNGSIRNFFPHSAYCGADLTEGPGVDVVADGHLLAHADATYDLTLSCECFEHNPYWLETFLNMYRMTRPGGIVAFSCATRGRLEHGTRRTSPASSPGTQDVGWDYYLNLEEKDFRRRVAFDELFADHVFLTNQASKDLYFVGQRPGATPSSPLRLRKTVFLERYRADQAALRRKIRRERAWYVAMLMHGYALLSLPIKLASVLPDKHFQNFAYYYQVMFVRPFRTPIKKILGN
jgi:SAM-dependent methyltransferase